MSLQRPFILLVNLLGKLAQNAQLAGDDGSAGEWSAYITLTTHIQKKYARRTKGQGKRSTMGKFGGKDLSHPDLF